MWSFYHQKMKKKEAGCVVLLCGVFLNHHDHISHVNRPIAAIEAQYDIVSAVPDPSSDMFVSPSLPRVARAVCQQLVVMKGDPATLGYTGSPLDLPIDKEKRR